MLSNRRILYLQPSELFGGAERQIAAVLPQFQKQGVAVTALVGPGQTIVDWLRGAGVKDIVRSPSFPRDQSEARGLGHIVVASEFVAQAHVVEREVEQLIEDRGIEAIVAGMAFSWVASTPAARRKGIPVLWRVGGMELSTIERVALKIWARRNPPDGLISNGQSVRDLFAPLVPAPSYIVRNGVDTDLFQPVGASASMRPRDARVVVGFAGRLSPQKRPQDFLQMVARIAPRHPEVRFLVAGDGSRRSRYEALAARLGILDRVQFLGQVRDIRSFYASCDLLVLPSRSEGSPNVVLEAMAMRLPVAASDTPATREVITHLRDGFLFPVGDLDRMTDTIEMALREPELRASVTARAFRKAQGPLSAAASAATLAGIIEGVLGGTREREVARAASTAGAAALAAA
ncbi:MAG TPA: glycosyltransferase [Polyangia bacterium]|nr:glycosyltransferase [Polyangia bacterium]